MKGREGGVCGHGQNSLLVLTSIAFLSIQGCCSQCSTASVMLWYMLSCLWDGAYKRSLAANWKELSIKWWQRVSLSLSELSFTLCLTP